MDQTRFNVDRNNSNPKVEKQEMHQSGKKKKTRERRNEPVIDAFLGSLNKKQKKKTNKLQKEGAKKKTRSTRKNWKEEEKIPRRKGKNKETEV